MEESVMNSTLTVGCGKAVIRYTPEMFPNHRENYTHVHDDTYVQVLILRRDETFAIVALETVISSEPDVIARECAKILQTSPDNIIVHVKHNLSAPHANRKETPQRLIEMAARGGNVISEEEAEIFVKRNGLICDAILEAAKEACLAAAGSMKEAVMRSGCTHTDIIVNRLVHTDLGWWQGHNPDIPADGDVPFLWFSDKNGAPLALVYNCNVAPGSLENSFLFDGSRAVSGDFASESERKLEAQYPGLTAIYTTGATADHWQALRAMHDETDKDGKQTVTDLHETGFELMRILTDRLTDSLFKGLSGLSQDCEEPTQISCSADSRLHSGLHLDHFVFSYTGVKVEGARMGRPSKTCTYVPQDERPLGLDVLLIDDTAILCVGVELPGTIWKRIREASPFSHNLILEFANYKGGGGYLPEKDYYDKITYQSLKTMYYPGTAEKFEQDIIAALHTLKDKYNR